MLRLMTLGLALTAITISAADGDDATREELKKLFGTWQLVSAVKDGTETPNEIVQKIRVVIEDGKHSVYFGDEVVAKQIPFTIDPTTTPKSTTDTLPEGRQIKGIYKLDGDMLTSCVGEVDAARPSEFVSKAGSGQTLREFKRVK
jgi:uncharacterized protein (TIGR03067 family)